uniref:Tripartite motif-containing protein 16-like n=1 Tax=Denticeps clupeoides TaxID=299321 RepID=A0AAY4A1Q2_9TELE
MAQALELLDNMEFYCPICLDLLKDPVAIPCGHSYCMDCIKSYWGSGVDPKPASCPQCRQTFQPQPILHRNTILTEMVEKLKTTHLLSRPPESCLPGPGDASCDFCTGTKLKAVKSCLVCLASYCRLHLTPHYESPALRRHKLVEASMHLQERICPHHDKLLEIFCQTDQQYICFLCVMDKHKSHDTVSAATERAKKQKFRLRIQTKEKELLELRQALDSLKSSGHAAMEKSDRLFEELIGSIERRRLEVRELVLNQEKAAERLLAQLERDISELKKKDAELDLLLHTNDHFHFLQSCQPFITRPGLLDNSSITIASVLDFGMVNSAVCDLKKKLEDILKGEWTKVSRAANTVKIVQSPVPMTRPEFLYYSCNFQLDRKTAHRDLLLSEDKMAVTVRDKESSGPDHPARFDYWCQVLSSKGLSGCCYWEAEWNGMGVNVAVAYGDMSCKGDGAEAHFGHNLKSWSLFCSKKGYYFWHNKAVCKVPGPYSPRIGVYLDHRAGTLSFYTVADSMTLLHRVQTSFTQPLHPGFGFACYGVSLKLCQMD